MTPKRSHPRLAHERTSAFTLVELLVVIATAALLIALFVPAAGKAREAGRRAVCASNLRQIVTAMTVYDLDYKDLPPGIWNVANIIRAQAQVELRERYGVSEDLITCPSGAPTQGSGRRWTSDGNEAIIKSYFYIGGHGGRSVAAGSQEHGWLISNFGSRSRGYFAIRSLSRPYHFKSTAVKLPLAPPAQSSLMGDFCWPRSTDTVRPHTFFPARANHYDNTRKRAEAQNMIFADAHVELMKLVPGTSWQVWGPSGGTSGGSGASNGGSWWITSRFKPPSSRIITIVD